MQKRIVHSVPKYGDFNDDVGILQDALLEAGYSPGTRDKWFGDNMLKALQAFQKAKSMPGTGVIPADGGNTFHLLNIELVSRNEETVTTIPAWFKEAKKMNGKRETDPAFNKQMSSKWKIVGLDLKTIATSWSAWCGLFVAVSLAGAGGFQWAKNGAGAANWDKYGQAIEWKKNGIPRGAIVRINHKAQCGTWANSHVGFANGNCTAGDVKAGGSFAMFGGNQSNMAKVSSFPIGHICSVRWPNKSDGSPEALPPAVEKSEACRSTASTGDTTR